VPVSLDGGSRELSDGSVVIAAITSCTNTSNPTVMVGAGLLARNAVDRGLRVEATVKTSLAPGSPVVMDYLRNAGLVEPLEKLGFYLVGFGCTTCIGNSGPLPDPIAQAIDDGGLACAAVLSGNRNFEGRIHPQCRMQFLASPPLVVAYALAGTVDIDLTNDPIGADESGEAVYLRDIWPADDEIAETIRSAMDPNAFRERYGHIFDGDERWNTLNVPTGALYEWDEASTYLREPPFVSGTQIDVPPPADVIGARVLVYVGDTVTTDHISPAGPIPASSPAGEWLQERGVDRVALHSYGARRGNHEVMVRGTFANIRLRNELAGGKEGGYTADLETGEVVTIFEASERYRNRGTPLVVLAGIEYGAGSSRDWAAKGTQLLGVGAVLAASFERIHRSNLAQMGVLPLELPERPQELGLTGRETFDIRGLADLEPGQSVEVVVHEESGAQRTITTRSRLDTATDVRYFREGGILPAVVRQIASR
jgi:aconitate hydratase